MCIGFPIFLYIGYTISHYRQNGGKKIMCEDMYHRSCGRHFLTTEEKIEKLQHYRKWLENETKGVEEAIKKLKNSST